MTHHNTCTVCGVPCSCKGGIKVRVLREDGTKDEATAIMCAECAGIARRSLTEIVTVVQWARASLNIPVDCRATDLRQKTEG